MADPYSPPGADQERPALGPVNRWQQAIAVYLIAGGAWGVLMVLHQGWSPQERVFQLSIADLAPFIFFLAAGVLSWRRRASGNALALTAMALQMFRLRIGGVEWALYSGASLELGIGSEGVYYGAHVGALFQLVAAPGPSYVVVNVVALLGLILLIRSLRKKRLAGLTTLSAEPGRASGPGGETPPRRGRPTDMAP